MTDINNTINELRAAVRYFGLNGRTVRFTDKAGVLVVKLSKGTNIAYSAVVGWMKRHDVAAYTIIGAAMGPDQRAELLTTNDAGEVVVSGKFRPLV